MTPTWQEAIAARDVEIYLRSAQLAGAVPLGMWSIRGFAPQAIDSLAPKSDQHPWGDRYRTALAPGRRVRAFLFSPELDVTATSGYPVVGLVDGAVWSGRGLSASATAGGQLRLGAFSAAFRPVVFWSQNAGFTEGGDEASIASAHQDPLWSCCIDLPQRFGDGAYARVDLGESYARVDLWRLGAGWSSATQVWGPSDRNPLILGAGSAGIPHAFVETNRPVGIGIGALAARVMAGPEQDSEQVPAEARPRYGAGAVVTFTPRGAPGLEIGATRFFHRWLPEDGFGLSALLVPFDDLLETESARRRHDDRNAPDYSPDNQIASAFARFVAPGSHLELWGEYAKNDHPTSVRDAIVEPDHDDAWALGARTLVSVTPARYTAVWAEYVSGGVSHLIRVRQQAPLYTHTPINQGHTQRGQLLASAAAAGGGGASVGIEQFDRGGSRSGTVERLVRQFRFGEGTAASGYDVIYRVRLDATRFGRRADVRWRLLGEYELNRDFRRDVPNVQLSVGLLPRRSR